MTALTNALLEELRDSLGESDNDGADALVAEPAPEGVEIVRAPSVYCGTHFVAGATFVRREGSCSVTIDEKGSFSFATAGDAVDFYIGEEF